MLIRTAQGGRREAASSRSPWPRRRRCLRAAGSATTMRRPSNSPAVWPARALTRRSRTERVGASCCKNLRKPWPASDGRPAPADCRPPRLPPARPLARTHRGSRPWRAHTVYAGGYHAEHAVVRMFWRVLAESTPTLRAATLRFTTSSARPPLLARCCCRGRVVVAPRSSIGQRASAWTRGRAPIRAAALSARWRRAPRA